MIKILSWFYGFLISTVLLIFFCSMTVQAEENNVSSHEKNDLAVNEKNEIVSMTSGNIAVNQEPMATDTLETTAAEGEYDYTAVDGGVYITKYKGEGIHLIIPEYLDGNKVLGIGDNAFSYCMSLETIIIPKGVTTIEDLSFRGCEKLETIAMPEGLTNIGDCALSGCISLKRVTIPESVKNIGNSAFHGDSTLKSMTIPESVESIGVRPFADCDNLTSLIIDSDNLYYASIENMLMNKSGSMLLNCPGGLEKANIPESVVTISEEAFYGCAKLKTLHIPESVMDIGENAFSICTSLESITVAEGNQNYSSVDGVVYNKNRTNLLICPGGIKTVKIPEGVQKIDYDAFFYCVKLKQIVLPKSVIIPDNAFEDCNRLEIYGVKGSSAEVYADKNKLAFFETTDDGEKLFTADKTSPHYIHSSIKLTADSEGVSNCQYKFYYTLESSPVIIQEFSVLEDATFVPDVAGIYTLYVEIKDAEGNLKTKSIKRYRVNESVHDLISSNVIQPYSSCGTGTLRSNIIDNMDGTKSVIEDNGIINIITYNNENRVISEKNIEYELPIFGAFFSGKQYNYIAFGQDNFEENDNKEVIRIVRYDKNYNRIDSVSIAGGESFTVSPFTLTAGRFSENENELVLHTSRFRYLIADGLNHQSNLTIVVDTSAMKVTNKIEAFQSNFVSHSFDQYVQFDGKNKVFIDHGDGAPRAIVLHKETDSGYCEVNLFEMEYGIVSGDTYTGVTVGGFEISSENYIVAMDTIDQELLDDYRLGWINENDLNRNIFLCVVPKNQIDSAEVKYVSIAEYIGSNKRGSAPKLVKISNEKLMVLWQEFDWEKNIQDLKYVYIDKDGEKIGDVRTISGYKLSDCDPQIIGDDVVWYTNEDGFRTIYSIPLSGESVFSVKDFKTDKLSKQMAGSEINLIAEGVGGIYPYQYKFYYKAGENIRVIQDFSESNKAIFRPTQAGTYSLYVEMKDTEGNRATKCIENYVITEEKIEFSYRTHVQNVGWQEWKTNGDMSGTTEKGLRLEGIEIKLDKPDTDLGVQYSTHIENIGWQESKSNGVMSGTTGKGLRLEAIKINLTGADKEKYDIYYQVHAQNFGWLDWAKNGAESGTAGFGYRLEGIKIFIVPKGDSAPGKTEQPFLEKKY